MTWFQPRNVPITSPTTSGVSEISDTRHDNFSFIIATYMSLSLIIIIFYDLHTHISENWDKPIEDKNLIILSKIYKAISSTCIRFELKNDNPFASACNPNFSYSKRLILDNIRHIVIFFFEQYSYHLWVKEYIVDIYKSSESYMKTEV